MASLSIRQINDILQANGTDYSDCLEKTDFLRKLKEVREKASKRTSAGADSSRGGGSARRTSAGSGGGARAAPRRDSKSKPSKPTAANTAPVEDIIKRILKDKHDYYNVMGLSKNAPEPDIKKAYKRLALKLHPDKCSLPGSEDAFKNLSEAFSVLSSADKRRDYDQFGAEGANGGMGGMRGNPFARAGRGGQHIDPEELFRQMFGGQFGGGRGGMGGFPGGMGGFPGGGTFHFSTGGPGGFGGFPGAAFGQGMGGNRRQRREQQRAQQDEAEDQDAGLFQVIRKSPLFPMMCMIGITLLGPLFLQILSRFSFLIPIIFMLPPERRPSMKMVIVALLAAKLFGMLD